MTRALLLAAVALALPAPSAGAATATWTKVAVKGAAPPKRSDAGLAATDARTAYLFGGVRGGSSLADLWRLDLKTRRWKPMKPAGARPPARFGHDLVATAEGALLLFGGQDGNSFFGDAWRYDPGANAWTKLSATGPEPRYGEGGAYDPESGTFYVTHGFTHDGRFDDTWALSAGGAWADLSPGSGRPLRRCLVGAVFRSDGIFLFGGQSDSVAFLGDLWRFDVTTRTWSEIRPKIAPSARNLYGSALLGDDWLIHAGITRQGAARDLWSFNIGTSEFSRVRVKGRQPSARSAEALTPLSTSRALLFGGAAPGETADTWVLKLAR